MIPSLRCDLKQTSGCHVIGTYTEQDPIKNAFWKMITVKLKVVLSQFGIVLRPERFVFIHLLCTHTLTLSTGDVHSGLYTDMLGCVRDG